MAFKKVLAEKAIEKAIEKVGEDEEVEKLPSKSLIDKPEEKKSDLKMSEEKKIDNIVKEEIKKKPHYILFTKGW